MSWHYLQEQEEESLEDICSGGEPLPPLRSKTTHAEFYCNGKLMDSYLDSLSGMTYAPLTEDPGKGKSMSSVGDSPAKTSALQEREKESKVSEAECGGTWPASLAKFDPATYSWRTAQCLLFEDSTECLETFPKWGMMHDGELWELIMSVPLISVNESGYVPTPCASDYKGGAKNGRDSEFKHWLKRRHGKTYPHPQRVEEMMGWPIGWTDLKPLETDKFHSALHSLGGS